jgi:hypothetical protein
MYVMYYVMYARKERAGTYLSAKREQVHTYPQRESRYIPIRKILHAFAQLDGLHPDHASAQGLPGAMKSGTCSVWNDVRTRGTYPFDACHRCNILTLVVGMPQLAVLGLRKT